MQSLNYIGGQVETLVMLVGVRLFVDAVEQVTVEFLLAGLLSRHNEQLFSKV